MPRGALIVVVASAALAVGCDEGYEPVRYEPDAVQYACVGFADAVCDGVFPAVAPLTDGVATVPPIALGAEFGFSGGTSLAPLRVEDQAGGGLLATGIGVAAVLAGNAVEHVEIRQPAQIRITHEIDEISGVFSQIFGEDDFNLRFPNDRFRAVPIDAQGRMLAGDMGCIWSSSDSSVVSVQSDPASNIVTFRIHGVGEATLRVTMGALEAEVPFTIEGG